MQFRRNWKGEEFPQKCSLFHKSMDTLVNSTSPKHSANEIAFPLASIMFQCTQIHSLVGINLTGGIPLAELVNHLGQLGMAAAGLLLVMEG